MYRKAAVHGKTVSINASEHNSPGHEHDTNPALCVANASSRSGAPLSTARQPAACGLIDSDNAMTMAEMTRDETLTLWLAQLM